MNEVITIGLDLAKQVFQAHGSDQRGSVVLRKKLRRTQVLSFFADLAPCTVAMEACASVIIAVGRSESSAIWSS